MDVALHHIVCCLGCDGVGVEGFGRRQGDVFSRTLLGNKWWHRWAANASAACPAETSPLGDVVLLRMFFFNKFDPFAENC